MATTHYQSAPAASRRSDGDTPQSTRRRLLDTAERLFADQGFATTSVRDITSTAGANLAAVNYHFGNKDGLYIEVFRRRLSELREYRIDRVQTLLDQKQFTLEQLIRAFAEAFVEPLADHEHGQRMCALYSREMLQPRLPRGMFFIEMINPIREVMGEAFGRVCPGIDEATSDRLLQSLVAQLLHVLQSRRMYEQAGIEDHSFADLEAAIDHTVCFSVAGVQAVCEATAGTGKKRKRSGK